MQDTPRRRTKSAHAAHVPARLQAAWADLVTKDRLSDKNPKPILKFLHDKYSFLRVSPESEI